MVAAAIAATIASQQNACVRSSSTPPPSKRSTPTLQQPSSEDESSDTSYDFDMAGFLFGVASTLLFLLAGIYLGICYIKVKADLSFTTPPIEKTIQLNCSSYTFHVQPYGFQYSYKVQIPTRINEQHKKLKKDESLTSTFQVWMDARKTHEKVEKVYQFSYVDPALDTHENEIKGVHYFWNHLSASATSKNATIYHSKHVFGYKIGKDGSFNYHEDNSETMEKHYFTCPELDSKMTYWHTFFKKYIGLAVYSAIVTIFILPPGLVVGLISKATTLPAILSISRIVKDV